MYIHNKIIIWFLIGSDFFLSNLFSVHVPSLANIIQERFLTSLLSINSFFSDFFYSRFTNRSGFWLVFPKWTLIFFLGPKFFLNFFFGGGGVKTLVIVRPKKVIMLKSDREEHKAINYDTMYKRWNKIRSI